MRTKTGELVRLASWKQSISLISSAIFVIVLFSALYRVDGGDEFKLKQNKSVPVPPPGRQTPASKHRPQPVIRSAGVIEQEKALVLSSERDLDLVRLAGDWKSTTKQRQSQKQNKPESLRHLKSGIYVVESSKNQPSAAPGLADLPPQIGRVRRRSESLRPIVAQAMRAPSVPTRRKLFSAADKRPADKPPAQVKQTQVSPSTLSANLKQPGARRAFKTQGAVARPVASNKNSSATKPSSPIQLATFEQGTPATSTESPNGSSFPVADSAAKVASDYRLPAPTARPRCVASPPQTTSQVAQPAAPKKKESLTPAQSRPATDQFHDQIKREATKPVAATPEQPPLVAQPIPRSNPYANSYRTPQAPKLPNQQPLAGVVDVKPETLSPGAGVKVQQLPANLPLKKQLTQPIAQPAAAQPAAPARDAQAKNDGPLYEVVDESEELQLQVRRSKILRTKGNVYRTAVVDPQICDVVHFTPREVSVIGKSQGATHVTFWFEGGPRPVTFLVRVVPDPVETEKVEQEYSLLEEVVADLFPDSKVRLVVVADKLIVSGQAKDNEEAAQIMAIVRSRAVQPGGQTSTGITRGGQAARVLSAEATGRQQQTQLQVINMLRVPGVHQVALRVKIAELNRSAARGFGVDVDAAIDLTPGKSSTLFLQSMLNVVNGEAPSLLTQFDGDDIQIGIRWLQQHGVLRLLSEPTLVTMSGRPATFVAGGEFAVPTVVGTAGLNAVTTDFRAFGVIISFMPTVVDKDRIRLQVSPEFSQINSALNVNNTPGLNVRAVTTTVEMREGQTLAIAGLLEDTLQATKIGDLPVLSKIFGRRDISRNETELIILVTPELIHPMQPEEVPPLPGFDVTEPSNMEFYLHGRLEGAPTQEYRSTVWPRLKRRYGTNGPAMISGPFGHGQ